LDNWNTFSQACKVPGANAGVVAEWNTLRGTSGNVAANSANALGAGYLQRLVGNTTYNFTSFRTVAANDGFIDVVLHWKNGVYVAEVETAGQLVETSIANTDLALFMNALPPGEVRLLACNSIEEAKLLSLRMNRPLVASDGWIDLYANGTITSEKAFVRLQAGNVVANLGGRVSSSSGAFLRLGEFFDEMGRVSWNGYSNIFKATPEEVAIAANRIRDYRTANNLSGGNYGYLGGIVNGNPVNNQMWRSVSINSAAGEIHIFDAIITQGANGNEWLRITDSEYRMLNKLASDLGASKGGRYPNITGELFIVSENQYCSSCLGIIQQFHEMFPTIKLILIDGAK
jgi:The  BURPS668_1122 family of deaminases